MPILVVRATKPSANSKLGFTYTAREHSTVVTGVSDAGIFGGTGLRAGQSILSINGKVVYGIGGTGVATVLRSIPSGEVRIIAEEETTPKNAVTFEFTTEIKGQKYSKMVRVRAKTSADENSMPPILEGAGVPRDEWLIIHTLILGILMSASLKCLQGNEDNRTRGGDVGLGFGSVNDPAQLNGGVKLSQRKGLDVSAQLNNATLVAVSVSAKVNSILERYGVKAVLQYRPFRWQEKSEVLIPAGFDFY